MLLRTLSLFVVTVFLVVTQAQGTAFEDTLAAALDDAKARNAEEEVTFLTNIMDASTLVRADHLSAVKQCKIGALEGELRKDKELAKRVVSKFADEVAKRVMPTLMGALQGAWGAAIGILLTDGGLKPDPFATVDAAYSETTHYTREQLRDAARDTFRTDAKAFKTLDVRRKAAAFACLL